jgi:exodeoxyribonuclease-3
LKLYSWNVNGLRAVLRKDAFRPFVRSADPDILCVQETKAQPGEAVADLPDYEEHWHSAEKKGYSGTAVFTKVKPISVSKGVLPELLAKCENTRDSYGNPHAEGRVLTVEYEKFHLVTAYTPNSKEDLSRVPLRRDHWDPLILEYCRCLEQTKPVVYCGDMNVAHTEMDLAEPKRNVGKKGFTDEERAGFQAFADAGFIDTFRLFTEGNGHYTWWVPWGGAREKNIGWRIDYFLVSNSLRPHVSAAQIHPDVMGSDHCPVSLELDI